MSADKAAVLEAAVPILSVTDLAEAIDYYERVLGFQVAWRWGEPPRLASVCRDRVELNLSQSSEADPRPRKCISRWPGSTRTTTTLPSPARRSQCLLRTVPMA